MNTAQAVATFLRTKGATIEAAVEERQIGGVEVSPFNTAKTASGLEVHLDCWLYMTYVENAAWTDVTANTFSQMFYDAIRARVQATLVPAEHCREKVATLDTVDNDGNLVKVRWDLKHRNPMGSVLKIGDEVYGVIQVNDLKSRKRLILDRPIPKTLTRGTPIYGCGVASNPPFNNFTGVTVVSAPRDDDPHAESTVHEEYEGLHFRTTRKPEANGIRCVVECLCGLVVDPTLASLR